MESDHGNGPQDKDRASRFRDLATRAARAAGVEPGANPFDAWLTRLKDADRYYVPVEIEFAQEGDPITTQSGWLSRVITASISECGALTTLSEIPPTPPPAHWGDIAIMVMTDFEVQIKVGTCGPKNFDSSAMGFNNKRTGESNRQWTLLIELSQDTPSSPWRKSLLLTS